MLDMNFEQKFLKWNTYKCFFHGYLMQEISWIFFSISITWCLPWQVRIEDDIAVTDDGMELLIYIYNYLCTTDRGGNRGVDGRRKTAPASASSPGVCQIRIIHLTILRTESQRTDFWTFWTDGVYILLNIIPVLKGKDSYV